MTESHVLIVDDDEEAAALLISELSAAGVVVEVAGDTFAAIEKLRETKYEAVVLDPMIGEHLNGYVVLNFMELEQPETLVRLFLLTGMSEQTIRRTAPAVLSRLFRKPAATTDAAAAVIELCNRDHVAAKPDAQGSVLLIEDDSLTAVAAMALLEHMGYAAEHVRNGADAWEMLSTRDYDAIMLDLVMPKVDGFAVLDQVHAAKPSMLPRVIVTTGMPEKYIGALDRHAIGGFIRKPIEVNVLEPLLRRVADRWQPPEGGGEMPD
jgi:DNA-binding response OmpR family regulator